MDAIEKPEAVKEAEAAIAEARAAAEAADSGTETEEASEATEPDAQEQTLPGFRRRKQIKNKRRKTEAAEQERVVEHTL